MKLKQIAPADSIERLSVSIRKSVLNSFEAYREFYKQTYGEEIERSKLVEEILKDYIASDRDFQASKPKLVGAPTE